MDIGCAVPGVGESSGLVGLGVSLNLGSISQATDELVTQGVSASRGVYSLLSDFEFCAWM